MLRVGPLPGDGRLVVVAGKVGGDGQAFDVLGVEPVGGGQLPVGLTPRLAFERLAASRRDHRVSLADLGVMRLLASVGLGRCSGRRVLERRQELMQIVDEPVDGRSRQRCEYLVLDGQQSLDQLGNAPTAGLRQDEQSSAEVLRVGSATEPSVGFEPVQARSQRA